MNVLSVMDVGYPVQGGSQITLMTFLQKLAARGHHCTYLDLARTRLAWALAGLCG